jgi:uncharacterized Zn-finger protein
MDSSYVCTHEGCEKSYSNAFNLKRHIESFHQGIKKFFCGICGKGLSSKQNMREHSFIHKGVKPYKCTVKECEAAFRQASQLSMHLAFHAEVSKIISESQAFPQISDEIIEEKRIFEESTDYLEFFPRNSQGKFELPSIKFEFSSTISDKN